MCEYYVLAANTRKRALDEFADAEHFSREGGILCFPCLPSLLCIEFSGYALQLHVSDVWFFVLSLFSGRFWKMYMTCIHVYVCMTA